MNKILLCMLIIALAGCGGAEKDASTARAATDTLPVKDSSIAAPDFFTSYPLLTLLRKTPVEIGCILEKAFQYRDPVFNCSYINYVNKGDPCVKTTEYYEGLKIPAALFTKMHAAIKDIQLDFEHGSLREINITFLDSLPKEKIRAIFNLPAENSSLPDNIMSINFGDNVYSGNKPADPNFTSWLTITGFEHMGAGDVDCP